MGRTLTVEQAKAREQSLAKSKLTRAHVTLPYADALGAHLITALPKEAGSYVLVWSETSVLIVSPPPPLDDDDDEEANRATSSKSPVSSGKRRKGSTSTAAAGASAASASSRKASISSGKQADNGAGSTDASMLATSPTSTANEYGKRRRGSTKTSGASQEDPSSMDVDDAAPSKLAKSGFSGLKILRLSLPRPVQVAAAAIVQEPAASSALQVDEAGTAASINVIFGTSAGHLNNLEVSLARDSASKPWSPSNMRVTRVGNIPRPQGPSSLAYLGEGILHVASASGDSVVVQLAAPTSDETDSAGADVEMIPLPTSPVATPRRKASGAANTSLGSASAAAAASSRAASSPDLPLSPHTIQTVRTFPSLAPILDFIIDGNALDAGAGGGAQGRIVAACGTGPDGALAIVKNGVTLNEVGSLDVPDVRRVWAAPLADGSFALVCGFAEHTGVLAMGGSGVEDVTDKIGDGSLAQSRTVGAYALSGGDRWIHVSDKRLAVIDAASGQQVTEWDPSATTDAGSAAILAVSVERDGVLVGLNGGRVVLLNVEGGAVQVVGSITLPNEVSCLHMVHGLAAIGQWNTNTVRLFSVPNFQDVTPSSMSSESGLGALPRSCLIHRFASSDESTASTAPLHLLIGLSTGAVLSYIMSLPTPDSFSKTIGLFDRKTSALGRRPLYLTPFQTTLGKDAVLATNGESSTVLWAGEGGRMSMSALAYPNVLAAAPLNASRANAEAAALVLALPTGLQISSVSEIDQLDISKVQLGLDNPNGVAGVQLDERGVAQYFAVTTTPYKPEGSATREQRASKLLVYGAVELDCVAEHALYPQERANCVSSIVLDDQEYIVVGTGFVKPDETETTDGRVLGFTLDRGSGGKASVLRKGFEHNVNGNVYALASAAGKLVVAVNSEVVTFGFIDPAPDNEEDDYAQEYTERLFRPLSKWGCAFVACTLSPIRDQPDRIVVGDGLRSLCLLQVDAGSSASSTGKSKRRATGRLTEVARDCDPFWTTAASSLDSASQTFIGADISFNLFTSQRAKLSAETKRRIEREAEKRRERAERGDSSARLASSNQAPLPNLVDEEGDWSHVMERRGGWHYGDMINRFREGALVVPAAASSSSSAGDPASDEGGAALPAPINPRLIFATSAGAIGIISSVPSPAVGKTLTEVERNLRSVLPLPLGGIPYEEWRTLRTDHRTSAPAGFLDGDLLLRYVGAELGNEGRRRILQGEEGNGIGKVGAEADEVERLLDGLARVC